MRAQRRAFPAPSRTAPSSSTAAATAASATPPRRVPSVRVKPAPLSPTPPPPPSPATPPRTRSATAATTAAAAAAASSSSGSGSGSDAADADAADADAEGPSPKLAPSDDGDDDDDDDEDNEEPRCCGTCRGPIRYRTAARHLSCGCVYHRGCEYIEYSCNGDRLCAKCGSHDFTELSATGDDDDDGDKAEATKSPPSSPVHDRDRIPFPRACNGCRKPVRTETDLRVLYCGCVYHHDCCYTDRNNNGHSVCANCGSDDLTEYKIVERVGDEAVIRRIGTRAPFQSPRAIATRSALSRPRAQTQPLPPGLCTPPPRVRFAEPPASKEAHADREAAAARRRHLERGRRNVEEFRAATASVAADDDEGDLSPSGGNACAPAAESETKAATAAPTRAKRVHVPPTPPLSPRAADADANDGYNDDNDNDDDAEEGKDGDAAAARRHCGGPLDGGPDCVCCNQGRAAAVAAAAAAAAENDDDDDADEDSGDSGNVNDNEGDEDSDSASDASGPPGIGKVNIWGPRRHPRAASAPAAAAAAETVEPAPAAAAAAAAVAPDSASETPCLEHTVSPVPGSKYLRSNILKCARCRNEMVIDAHGIRLLPCGCAFHDTCPATRGGGRACAGCDAPIENSYAICGHVGRLGGLSRHSSFKPRAASSAGSACTGQASKDFCDVCYTVIKDHELVATPDDCEHTFHYDCLMKENALVGDFRRFCPVELCPASARTFQILLPAGAVCVELERKVAERDALIRRTCKCKVHRRLRHLKRQKRRVRREERAIARALLAPVSSKRATPDAGDEDDAQPRRVRPRKQ